MHLFESECIFIFYCLKNINNMKNADLGLKPSLVYLLTGKMMTDL